VPRSASYKTADGNGTLNGTPDAATPPHKGKTCGTDLLTESIITASMVKKM
jgi:hypothetical protein